MSLILFACSLVGCGPSNVPPTTVLSLHTAPYLRSLAISPDNQYVAAITNRREFPRLFPDIVVLNVASGEKVFEKITEGLMVPTDLVFTRDSETLIISYGMPRPVYSKHDHSVRHDMHGYGKQGRLAFYHLDHATEEKMTLPCGAYEIAISPDGKILVIAGADQKSVIRLFFFNMETRIFLSEMTLEGLFPAVGFTKDMQCQTLAFSPDGKWIGVAQDAWNYGLTPGPERIRSTRITLIDTKTFQAQASWALPHGAVGYFDFGRQIGQIGFIARGYGLGTAFFDSAEPQKLIEQPGPIRQDIGYFAFMKNPNKIIGCRLRESRDLFHLMEVNLKTKAVERVYSNSSYRSINGCFAISHDRSLVAVGDRDRQITIWKLKE